MRRRAFLSLLGGTALAWPRTLDALARDLQAGGDPQDEDFWSRVKDQFLIPPDRIYLNNGTLGPSPEVVVEAVHEHARRVASTYPPGVDWDDLKGSVGAFIGADPEGLVFPRITSTSGASVRGRLFPVGKQYLSGPSLFRFPPVRLKASSTRSFNRFRIKPVFSPCPTSRSPQGPGSPSRRWPTNVVSGGSPSWSTVPILREWWSWIWPPGTRTSTRLLRTSGFSLPRAPGAGGTEVQSSGDL